MKRRVRKALGIMLVVNAVGCRQEVVAPATRGDARIELSKGAYSWREVFQRTLIAQVRNAGRSTVFARAQDGFGGALVTSTGSDAVVQRWDGKRGWTTLPQGTAVEGIRTAALTAGATYELWADLTRGGLGTYRLRLVYGDSTGAAQGTYDHVAYSATFVVK